MLITDYLENSFFNNKKNDLIITDDFTLSYDDCNKISDFFAFEIHQKKTNSKIISIIMEKGWEQIIAVFSILKSGNTYLPININESKERTSEILRICDVEVVLLKENSSKFLVENFKKIKISMETYLNNHEKKCQKEKNHKITNPLAYIMFTSGSTGLPKGVMINHVTVLNTVFDINKRFHVGKGDKIIFLSALNFDLSVYDIFGGVFSGASIVIPDENKINEPRYLAEIIARKKVTIWNSVPVLMEMLVSYIERTEEYNKNAIDFLSLRLVLLSGDWIPVLLPNRIKKIFKNAKIISLGGATEASIWSIIYEINKIDKKWKSIPYGKPMKNQNFYILDENLKEINYGEIGELYISGKGLAEGYWKDKKNTEANFIYHKKFQRLYKTGDLGRYMSDGNIEFIGRVDSQVKINGFRVELGAIESSILKQKGIKQAVVVPVKNKGKLIYESTIAYIKSDLEYLNIESLDESEIEITNRIIENWKKTYNAILSTEEINSFNVSGWVSSFSGSPIPNEEMEEWANLTAEKILSLKPQKVLEIGCGTGLIFFKIIDSIEEYTGSDFSTEILRYFRKSIKKNKIKKNIYLYDFAAHDISKIKDQYDTVIINSVIQYFPTLKYMFEVIDSAISLTKAGGNIFIGDVRNYENIDHYYLNSIIYKLNNTKYKHKLNYELYSLSLNQKELLVSPKIFFEYFLKNPRVTDIEIQVKSGKYQNEMNNFRYDIVIRIESEDKMIDVAQQDYIDWEIESISISKLLKKLLTDKKDFLYFRNIPNRRICILGDLLKKYKNKRLSDITFAEINEGYNNNLHYAVDPYDLKEIAKESGYQVILTATNFYTMKKIDAIFYKNINSEEKPKFSSRENYCNKISAKKLFNNPVKNVFIHDLIIKTKESLKESLPYYMIPDRIIYLDNIPISENGKIDRKNLPYSDVEDDSKTQHTDDLYIKLILMLSRILNNSFLNTDNSFRDNGGTSLDAVHVCIDIYNEFFINIDVGDIMSQKMSIRAIGDLIRSKLKWQRNKVFDLA